MLSASASALLESSLSVFFLFLLLTWGMLSSSSSSSSSLSLPSLSLSLSMLFARTKKQDSFPMHENHYFTKPVDYRFKKNWYLKSIKPTSSTMIQILMSSLSPQWSNLNGCTVKYLCFHLFTFQQQTCTSMVLFTIQWSSLLFV